MDSGGHWLAANRTRVQIVLMWALSSSSELGSATDTRERLASPRRGVRTALSAGCPLRFIPPLRLRASFGLKAGSSQDPTWKGRRPVAPAPLAPAALATTDCGEQLVGLSAKSERSILAVIERIRSGMPSSICGIGSVLTETWALSRST